MSGTRHVFRRPATVLRVLVIHAALLIAASVALARFSGCAAPPSNGRKMSSARCFSHPVRSAISHLPISKRSLF